MLCLLLLDDPSRGGRGMSQARKCIEEMDRKAQEGKEQSFQIYRNSKIGKVYPVWKARACVTRITRNEKRNYEQALTRFVEKFRAGQADLYGYHNIIRDFFFGGPFAPEDPVEMYPCTMTSTTELQLSSRDKIRIMKKVLKKTGFTKEEAQRLAEEAHTRNLQSRGSKEKDQAL